MLGSAHEAVGLIVREMQIGSAGLKVGSRACALPAIGDAGANHPDLSEEHDESRQSRGGTYHRVGAISEFHRSDLIPRSGPFGQGLRYSI